MEINLPPVHFNGVYVYGRRRSFYERKKIHKKDTGNGVTQSIATDLGETENLFSYEESLHTTPHQDYHTLVGSTTMIILLSDSWKGKEFLQREIPFFFTPIPPPHPETGYTHMHSCELHLLAERHSIF